MDEDQEEDYNSYLYYLTFLLSGFAATCKPCKAPRWQREDVKWHGEQFLFCFSPERVIFLNFITLVSSHSFHSSPNPQVPMYQTRELHISLHVF